MFLCIQCSEGFMHTRMRRRVESLIDVSLQYYMALYEYFNLSISKLAFSFEFCMCIVYHEPHHNILRMLTL